MAFPWWVDINAIVAEVLRANGIPHSPGLIYYAPIGVDRVMVQTGARTNIVTIEFLDSQTASAEKMETDLRDFCRMINIL